MPLIYYKDRNEIVESKLHVKSLSVSKKANIRRLNIDANIKQLIDGIDGISARLNRLQNSGARLKRNADAEESLHTVNVKRLNIPKELFESKFLVHVNRHRNIHCLFSF